MPDFSSLLGLLRYRTEQQPNALLYRFLETGDVDGPVQELTFAQLDTRARAIAAQLQAAQGENERALLLYPPGLEFIAAFMGCAYAGVVAVPTYPHRTLSRLEAIVQDSQARFVLTTSAFFRIARSFSRQAPDISKASWIPTDTIRDESAAEWRQPEITGDTLAFLQYTSGSTGNPKGVMVSHANLLHNEQLISQGFGTDSSVHVVGWLPLYHDMGLIGNVLQPLYLGASCTLMSPLAFLQRPMRWLEAIARFHGTVSGGPNFAFDLCASKKKPDEYFDLSSWEVAFNGSEPIRKETLDRFAEVFAPWGFRAKAFYPCYGLAEATLFVTGVERNVPQPYQTVLTAALEQNFAEKPSPDDQAVRTLVSCGHSQPQQHVLVVNPETCCVCPERVVGEIWVAGPSVAAGYWRRPKESTATFAARLAQGDTATSFLRTGDLGFFADGELFVTGRIKDLIIIRGRNLYPHDIEFTVQEAHPVVRPDGCAAFSLELEGEEKLVVIAEVQLRGKEIDAQEIIETIRRAVVAEHGTHVHTVTLIKPKSLPKTSSGKIRRDECRKKFVGGSLTAVTLFVDAVNSSLPEEQDAFGRPGLDLGSASLLQELELAD